MKIRTVASGVTLIALITCFSYTSVAQQTKERVIRRLPVEQNEPLGITDAKVNGLSVSFDKTFLGDDDWISTIVISVKNTSHKRILFASIQLQFPRRDPKDRFFVFEMFQGNWSLQGRAPTPDERLIGIAPGETAGIQFSNEQFSGLRKFLAETHYPSSVERLDIRVDKVIFEDDSMWSRGSTLRRDPNNSETWINSDLRSGKVRN
jgi:hypothetical protein